MSDFIENILAENPFTPGLCRSAKGYWNEAAAAVAALVRTGFPVTEACRRVLKSLDKPFTQLPSLRAAYYNHYSRSRKK